MSTNKDLLHKYNSVVARNKDLRQQIDTKESQWQDREDYFKVTEKNTRELCEKILATNRDEMELGKAKSWRGTDLNEILRRTTAAYLKYQEENRAKLTKIMNINEDRRLEYEVLKTKYNRLLASSGKLTDEELTEQIEKEEKDKEFEKHLTEDEKNSAATIKRVEEDDNDSHVDEEIDLYDDIDNINQTAKITKKSIKTTQNKRNFEAKKKRRQNAEKRVHSEEIDELRKHIPANGWIIIETMGETGFSVYQDIESEVIKRDRTMTSGSIRVAMRLMESINLFESERVKNPLKKSFSVYEFSNIGVMLYKDQYGKQPKASEMGIILKEHDNLEHGYGIKAVADAFKDIEVFETVEDKNRKKPIKINDIEYIPDIVCVDKNGRKYYYEYERGNTPQSSFNGKCSKMNMVTEILQFIAPNKESVDKLRDQVQRWINNKGAKALTSTTVRISSASQIVGQGVDIVKDKAWAYVFKPGKKGDVPFTNY